ncbi:MAG TPA: GEVED domain-containing protein [Flavipsychrobacter sp.]
MKPDIMQLLKKLTLSLICLSVFTVTKAQVDFQVGTGTTINQGYEYPVPIGHYFEGSRTQFLFPASELTAAGIFPGAILAIKWDVKNLGTGLSTTLSSLNEYYIYIGTTTMTSLTSFATGITNQVYYTPTLTPSVGIMTFNFSTPFVWNGTDNIVVQVCHGDGSLQYTSNAGFEYATYSYNASQVYYVDNTAGACNVNTVYNNNPNRRPNTIFSMGLPCNDTPKTEVKGPDKICPGKPFTLGPSNYYANATYLWEYSNNGTTWANFTGVANGAGQIKDSIFSAKWYRVTVKCNGNPNLTYTSPPHKVNIAPFYYCYCDNEVTSDAGADIGNLTIIKTGLFDSVYKKGQLVTGSATPVYNNKSSNRKYTSYHDSLGWPCLYRDTTYLFNVTQIHSGGSFETGVVQAYIDYNRDGLYNPNTERVFVQAMNGLNANPHIVQVTGKVPSSAQIGPTGMRVIISKDTVKGAPCDTISGGGEVEDYIVEICHRPCTGPVNAGLVVSTDSSMCAGYEYTLTDTTYERSQSGFLRA